MLLDNLHTNLSNVIENLKIRSRDDNPCESANLPQVRIFDQSAHIVYARYLIR